MQAKFIGGPFDGKSKEVPISRLGRILSVTSKAGSNDDHLYYLVNRVWMTRVSMNVAIDSHANVEEIEVCREYEYIKETTCRSKS